MHYNALTGRGRDADEDAGTCVVEVILLKNLENKYNSMNNIIAPNVPVTQGLLKKDIILSVFMSLLVLVPCETSTLPSAPVGLHSIYMSSPSALVPEDGPFAL